MNFANVIFKLKPSVSEVELTYWVHILWFLRLQGCFHHLPNYLFCKNPILICTFWLCNSLWENIKKTIMSDAQGVLKRELCGQILIVPAFQWKTLQNLCDETDRTWKTANFLLFNQRVWSLNRSWKLSISK